MISRKFIKSSFIYTISGILPMASAVLLLPFYLSFLPLEKYGALALYISFSMFVQIITTYSFDTSLYVYYHDFKNDKGKLSHMVSSAFVFMIILGVVVLIFFTLFGNWLFEKISERSNLSFFPYGFLSVLTAIFQAFFKVHSSLLQSRQKPETFFWSNLISFSLIASFTIWGLIIYPGELVGPVGGRALAVIISGSWALTRIFREFDVHFNFPFLKASFNFNNSSYIYQLQQWLINYFDRLLITFYLTLQAVGSYDFAWKCLLVIDFVIAGLYNSFYPKVISILSPQEKKQSTIIINRYYHGLTAVMMLLVTSSILFLPFVIDFVLMKSDYDKSLEYIPYVALIYLTRPMKYYFGLPYGALKYTKPLPLIYLAISAFKIVLMVFYIPKIGLWAVIGSSLASSIVEIILLRVSIKEKFYFHFNASKIVIAPLSLATAILFLEPTVNMNRNLLHGFYLLFTIIILWWLYRHELRSMELLKLKNNLK